MTNEQPKPVASKSQYSSLWLCAFYICTAFRITATICGAQEVTLYRGLGVASLSWVTDKNPSKDSRFYASSFHGKGNQCSTLKAINDNAYVLMNPWSENRKHPLQIASSYSSTAMLFL
jgi:hypothetical protein